MAGTILGVDIGHNSARLALCRDGVVRKTATLTMPENLLREGRLTSPDAMGEVLRTGLREHGIRAAKASLTLPGSVTYLRTVTMPRMTAEQLVINLPYEFNDYINDEPKNYVFDYAMLTPSDSAGNTMELLASAAPAAALRDYREAFRKAGIKLAKAVPAECAFISLIRRLEAAGEGRGEYCFLDLGSRAIRMYLYRGSRHMVTRELEFGLSTLDEAIAAACNVDVRLAHTYLLKNHDDCWNQEYCRSVYGNISVELQRSLNFYSFSNPDSNLTELWLCGGGAAIVPLAESIGETTGMAVRPTQELLRRDESAGDCNAFVLAIGGAAD